MRIPIPIYSLAYSRLDKTYFKNLEALSKNSFGIYYNIGETTSQMQRVVEQVQNILQSDYVVTFRSYVPVDGVNHNIKLGIEYPSGSGKYVYDDATFEAIQPPPVKEIEDLKMMLDERIPELPRPFRPLLVRQRGSRENRHRACGESPGDAAGWGFSAALTAPSSVSQKPFRTGANAPSGRECSDRPSYKPRLKPSPPQQ